MSARLALAVAVVAACGGKSTSPSEPKASGSSQTKLAAAGPSCIRPIEDQTFAIEHAVADGARVKYCVGDAADQCFALDTSSGAFEKLAEPPKPAAPHAHVETTTPDVKVCQNETCTTLTQRVLANSAHMRAATNSNGSLAVFLLGDAPAGKGFAEVWDVAAAKKLATFRYARGDYKCGDRVAIIDDTIYVSATTCGSPAARAALYSLSGRRIATVGGQDFGVYGDAYAQVDFKKWAFLEENGQRIVIQDLARGKVVKKIDTSALFVEGGGGAPMGNPGESALVRIDATKLAVIGGAPATGHVAVVDVTSGEVKVLKAEVCAGVATKPPPPDLQELAPTRE